jgi:large subunit ribosomal protein L11
VKFMEFFKAFDTKTSAVNLAKGSAEPNKNKVGKITEKQVEEIAKIKMPDLNCFALDAAVRSVKGTARSMGVDIA